MSTPRKYQFARRLKELEKDLLESIQSIVKDLEAVGVIEASAPTLKRVNTQYQHS